MLWIQSSLLIQSSASARSASNSVCEGAQVSGIALAVQHIDSIPAEPPSSTILFLAIGSPAIVAFQAIAVLLSHMNDIM